MSNIIDINHMRGPRYVLTAFELPIKGVVYRFETEVLNNGDDVVVGIYDATNINKIITSIQGHNTKGYVSRIFHSQYIPNDVKQICQYIQIWANNFWKSVPFDEWMKAYES